MAKSIPPAKLRVAVREAARAAFSEIRKKHPKETFYVFGLMTNDAAQYLFPMSNTEQGLKRTVKKYRQDGNPDQTEDELRWSFGDWTYAKDGEAHFDAVNEMLAVATEFDDVDDDEIEKIVGKLMDAVVAGLKDLDQEGFFGEGTDRLEIAVMIVGDLDAGLTREWVAKLNPPAVATWVDSASPTEGNFRDIGSKKVSGSEALSVSRDGKLLVTGGDSHIFAYTLPEFGETLKKRVGAYKSANWGLHTIRVAPDGSELAIGWKSLFNEDGGIERWSIPKQKRLDAPPVLQGGVYALDYSPDGGILASGGQDGVIRLWDLATRQVLREMPGHTEFVRWLRYSPDGKWLATMDHSAKGLRIWNPATGELVHHVTVSGSSFAFTPDGQSIAVAPGYQAKGEPVITFWDVKAGTLSRQFSVNLKAECVAFSSDGQRMAIGGAIPGLAELWDLVGAKRVKTLNADYVSLDDMAFVCEDRAIAISGWANERRPPILLWDLT